MHKHGQWATEVHTGYINYELILCVHSKGEILDCMGAHLDTLVRMFTYICMCISWEVGECTYRAQPSPS